MKEIDQYREMAEDELGRTVMSMDGTRNLVTRYCQQAVDLIYSAHPWLWLLAPEGTAGEDIVLVADQHLATLPTDLLDIRSARLIDAGTIRWRLTPRNLDWIDERWPDLTLGSASQPKVYARIGKTQIKFAPRANAAYTIRLRFTRRPVALAPGTLSLIPDELDWLVAEAAAAFGFNRLRMYSERDSRFVNFSNSLKVAIEEDRNELQQEYAAQPYNGPGSIYTGALTGDYWNMPDIRGIE